MSRFSKALRLMVLMVLISFGLLMLISEEPMKAFVSFITGPFANLYSFGNTLAITSILIICGAGVSISFRAGLFNLGGEGQIYSSALIGTLTGLLIPAGTGPLGILAVILTSMVSGALIAGISGLLKYRYKIHELISSFLLSGALIYTVDFLISNPLRDKESFLQTTRQLPEAFHLQGILPPSNLTGTIFIALAVALGLGIWLYRMPGGYELRVFGTNGKFAAFGGISRRRYTILPLLINGACYGLAGALMVLSTQHASIVGFTSGYGWNGITIALIAGTNPIMTIPASLLLAWIETGTRASMAGTSLSFELSEVIRGIILLLITLDIMRKRSVSR